MNQTDVGWDLQQARQTYAMAQWGEGYFDINAAGHVCVRTCRDPAVPALDLYTITQQLHQQGYSLPFLLRFTDILQDRVQRLQQAFAQAAAASAYQGAFTAVYPIKVNQQYSVIQTFLRSADQGIGLEAGSKAELLAVLALAGDHRVICNGYKDRTYIRQALIGQKLGQDVWLIIEKLKEVPLILQEAKHLGISPRIGVRMRLASVISGKWQNSGGEKAKFGLNPADVLRLLTLLKQQGQLGALQMAHFHMGSQVASIRDIQTALREAGRHYAELHRAGAPIHYLNVGGGLGVDYEGSRSNSACSINYSLDEYAHNIVRIIGDICTEHQVPHPHLITESGRALSAHHAVLITDVIDVESQQGDAAAPPANPTRPVLQLHHDNQFELQQARAAYLQGQLRLDQLAAAEQTYINRCNVLQDRLDPSIRSQRDTRESLRERLADKVFCNLSIFQSMPDIWGIGQVFPIMPIHRLAEKPQRRAIIQDLTCDSDGCIQTYVDGQNLEATLPLHAIEAGETYLIGFFMLGAYQETLGDMHNLFGDTHAMDIRCDGQGGYQVTDIEIGDTMADLLRYVHIEPEALKQRYRQKLQNAELSEEDCEHYLQAYCAGLAGYTYLHD